MSNNQKSKVTAVIASQKTEQKPSFHLLCTGEWKVLALFRPLARCKPASWKLLRPDSVGRLLAVPVSGLACLGENEGPHERAHNLPNPVRVALRFDDDVRRRQQQQLATANGLSSTDSSWCPSTALY